MQKEKKRNMIKRMWSTQDFRIMISWVESKQLRERPNLQNRKVSLYLLCAATKFTKETQNVKSVTIIIAL